jgi:K+-transporting ATPase A subunit
MTLKEKINYHFTRDSVAVSRGPAAFIGIKHIGTNGGGFFGVNSAHPLENPLILPMRLNYGHN